MANTQPPTQSTQEAVIQARQAYIRIFEDNTLPNLFRKLCSTQHGLETDEVFRLLSFVNIFDDTDEETKVRLINILSTLPALAKQGDDGLETLNPGLRGLGCRLDLEDADMDGVIDGKIMRVLRDRISSGFAMTTGLSKIDESAENEEADWREMITWISGSMHMLVLSIMGEGDVEVGAGMVGIPGVAFDVRDCWHRNK